MQKRVAWLVSASMLLGVMLWLTPTNAHACRCVSLFPEVAAQKADMIFSGKVQKVNYGSSGFFGQDDPVALIEVDETWKGVSESHVLISTPIGCCDYRARFDVGEKYLVFATKTGNGTGLTVYGDGTSSERFMDQYLAVLGESRPPTKQVDPDQLQVRQKPMVLVLFILVLLLVSVGAFIYRLGKRSGPI